ncbi:MAG TPA: preprotein translocase subunit SecG [Verrucomicrobiae bacterium]|nr:preprotein translocase subunit SecG [Verrucomicrobiae bacterium]
MSFIIGILTFLMVITCLLLILLVLVQLPKKDAGAGLAFGGGAADALFGAGSGNALTKITKWATGIFIALAILLGILQNKTHTGGDTSAFEKAVQQKQMQTPITAPTTTTPAVAQPAATLTNNLLAVPLTAATNPTTAAPTNSSAK